MNENVRSWYRQAYPNDGYALIHPNLTFSDVFIMLIYQNTLDNHINCPYVKERIFKHIIEVTGIDEAFFRELAERGAKGLFG